jgi:hypothetical protein
MLATWGPATAAAYARYDGEPDPEILAAAQSRDAAIMADPVARRRREIDFWAGRLDAELCEVETIDDYRRQDDHLAEPLAADQRNRFRKALHLVQTGAPIPECYLARRRTDCLDMAGHAAAGLHRASAALLMALGAQPRPPAQVVAHPAATVALPADSEPSQAA